MPIPGGSRATRKLSFVGRISIDKRASSDRSSAGKKPTSGDYCSQEPMRQAIMRCGHVGILYGIQHRR
jgi:hypothetical protein